MARYSKPETADRSTINKQSIISPSNTFVSKDAKDTMKSNFQVNKQSVNDSKPTTSEVTATDTADFENAPQSNYIYQDPLSPTGNTSDSEETIIEDESTQTGTTEAVTPQFDDQDIIYDDTVIPIVPQDNVKSSPKFDYVVAGDKKSSGFSSNSNNYQGTTYQIPKGTKMNIIPYAFNNPQRSKTHKTQILLHHTVSQPGLGKGVIDTWNRTKFKDGSPSTVAVHYVLDTDGTFYQCFDLDFWADHVGVKHKNNSRINQTSIGIEVVNWGGLTNRLGAIYSPYGNVVGSFNDPSIISFPSGYRGYYFYQRYTKAQIDALSQMLLFLGNKYGIPMKYNSTMWDLSQDALGLKPGIWTHTSYRDDKSDMFPQDDLIGMLKSLNS